ncbi:MAG: hypothetical protein WKF59_20125 [Chitinophagaceae bacterium]
MKRLSTIALMMCFTTLSFGQGSIQTEKSRIKESIVKSFDEIWSELNSKKINKYYTKDFLLLENGEVWNNDSISNYLDKAVLKKPIPIRVNSIDIIEIKVLKKTGWIAYRNNATFSIENKIVRKAHWLESATVILTENGWKLQMLHSTVIKNE